MFKCPKDSSLLEFIYETEKTSDLVKVSMYYKCPLCGFRKDIEKLELRKAEQGILIKRSLYPPH